MFWLPAGVVPGRPVWGCAAAGAFGLPGPPGAVPEGGVFWLPAGVVPGRPATAGGFGLPAPPVAGAGAPPAGLGAELGDGAFASEAGPEDGVPSAVVPPAVGAADSPRAPAVGGFEAAASAAGVVRLSGVAGFAPPGEGGCPDPVFRAVPVAGPETPGRGAEAGEFGVPAAPFAGFAPPAFGDASVLLDEVGPLPGVRAPGALGTAPRAPASAFGFVADAPGPEADVPVPEGSAFDRCALAMRSVGAADPAGPLFSAAGTRSLAAPGRASAPAASAGSALFRAGFFSSFGSDTHTPRQAELFELDGQPNGRGPVRSGISPRRSERTPSDWPGGSGRGGNRGRHRRNEREEAVRGLHGHCRSRRCRAGFGQPLDGTGPGTRASARQRRCVSPPERSRLSGKPSCGAQ